MAQKKENQNFSLSKLTLAVAAVFSLAFPVPPVGAQAKSAQAISDLPSSETAAVASARSSLLTSAVNPETSASDAPDGQGAPKGRITIPLGTILPLRLNTSLSSSKTKAGQPISGRVMQTVALPGGGKIPHGSKVLGHVVEASAGTASSPARISLQFDELVVSGQTIPITTHLRAIAGFVAVQEAQTPTIPAGQGDNYNQLTTVQVGGDVVFGWGGPVTRSDDTSQVVGKAVADGVVGQVRAKEGTKCRGALYGDDRPQSLWVFSSDACGVYGLEHVVLAHAGRSTPVGVIVFGSDINSLFIHSGAGILLRVTDAGS